MSTKTNIKKARFDTRLPVDQKRLLERAAAIGGYRNLTDFIILSAQEKAKIIIQQSEAIIASERDSEIFFSAVLKASEPNEELIKAAKAYKNEIQK